MATLPIRLLSITTAALALVLPAHAQQTNKAERPPVEAAASQAGVATKQPAKPGSQSGAASAPAAGAASAAQGNKAAKPPASDEAARSGVATKKPAKPGAQAGPASAPSR
jgi:hypothetical protein